LALGKILVLEKSWVRKIPVLEKLRARKTLALETPTLTSQRTRGDGGAPPNRFRAKLSREFFTSLNKATAFKK
jgi:hypothetical protein